MDLKSLQKRLKAETLGGYYIPMGNLFIGEDTLEEENPIRALTGFTGSYALFFVTPLKAYLFVDGRYEVQAKKEVNLKQIEIVKLAEISFSDWLIKNYGKTAIKIAYNPWTISLSTLNFLKTKLPKATFIADKDADKGLSAKPAKIFEHAKKYTGTTAKEKISALATTLKKEKLNACLITSAASVSWLLNLRSNALPCTPIIRAYVLVEASGNYTIFAENITGLKIKTQPFEKLQEFLPKYKPLGVDFSLAPAVLQNYTSDLINYKDPVIPLKAVKNKTELKGMENAHIRDGAALCKFLYWLSKNYKGKTECDIAEKLHTFRQKEENFYSESFETIAGFSTNAAIVHYHANPKTAAVLKKNSLLLLDSGAQYFDGTTDVTRTVALGTPTPEMIEKNTFVLKAHIALASALFPENTSGSCLDLIARQPLYKQGLDFAHGTGHGVGHFSNVHEGPARISSSLSNDALFKAGMITSIEPGYYRENAFGIRIENLYKVKPAKNPKLLCFEVLTLAPLDKSLINKYLLSAAELEWLNNYHKHVFQSLKKYLTKQELQWLKVACAPL